MITHEQQDELNRIDAHIGRRIRSRREELRISQAELGEALGVSYQAIQKFEGGRTHIAAAKLAVIASRLSVNISYFFEGLERARTASRKLNALDPEQNELIDLLLFMPREARKAVTDALRLLVSVSPDR